MSISDSLTKLRHSEEIEPDVFSVANILCHSAVKLLHRMKYSDVGDYEELTSTNPTGDTQTKQDEYSHKLFSMALSTSKYTKLLLSEESLKPIEIGNGNLSVAIDPFDGSRAYRYGIPAGTIFGIFRHLDGSKNFSGAAIVGAGLIVYGLELEIFLAINRNVYKISSRGYNKLNKICVTDRFVCANLSNMSKWAKPWQAFFDSYVVNPSTDGFNTRWFGSLAAHTKTIILSGGLFAYPPDERSSYRDGHLRLVYEAIPISYLIECLGGRSSDGLTSILKKEVVDLHSRTPLVVGESSLVNALEQLIQNTR